MTISTPVAVAGELITAANWNLIRTDLVELESERGDLGPHHLRYVPGGNVDAGAGGYNDWLPLGNVTVPTFATAAIVVVSINRFFASTTGAPDYLLRIRVGATGEANPSATKLLDASTTIPQQISFVGYVATPPTGVQAINVQGNRAGGTGVARATTATLVTASVLFRA